MGKGEGKGSGKGSGGFSDDQLEMYRECFKLMDVDKDGVINKNDLRAGVLTNIAYFNTWYF